MAVSGLIRRRALLLLVAFFFSLAGQAVAGAAMASQMTAPAPVSVTAPDMCPGCGGDNHVPTMLGCAMPFCASMPAMPAQSASSFDEPPADPDFVAAPYEIPPGVISTPDPHPPKSFLHA